MPTEPINLAHLRTFMRVVQCGSATKAGQSLFRAQSAITRSIHELEGAIGEPLFERRRSGMLPTQAGQTVLHRAKKVFAELDEIAHWCACRESSGRTRSSAGTPSYLLNTRRLQLLVSLAKHLHMPTVARVFDVSQPAISSAVKAIEAGSGFRLFDRTAGGLRLTAKGEMVVINVRCALNELRHIPADIAALAGNIVGEVTIGALPLARAWILPEAISNMHRAFPGVKIRTDESPYETLVVNLLAGDIDFILGALRPVEEDSELRNEALMSEEMVVLVRSEHPLADIKDITLKQLVGASWILPRSHSPARVMLDAVFARKKLSPPSPAVETSDLALTRALLLRTEMVAALSAQHWDHDCQSSGHLVPLDLALPDTRREIGFTFRAGSQPSPAAQRVISAVMEAVIHRTSMTSHSSQRL
jgi:LysR family transcriptional regulator of gallate degradation